MPEVSRTAIGWALLSAFFAGLTAILAKIGVQGVPSNVAMAVRTGVVMVLAWGIMFARGESAGLQNLSGRTWLFLTLSGIATGLSWLAYFRALALGDVSRVAPIDKLGFVLAAVLGFVLLGERPSWPLCLGIALIVGGVLLTMKA